MDSLQFLPQVKFRTPRVRPSTIPRTSLVQSLAKALREQTLTVVTAPAGFGKTTVLSQAVGQLSDRVTVRWVSLDQDDNALPRFAAVLMRALGSLALEWDIEPPTVGKWWAGDATERANATAVVVNALASLQGELVIVFDDFHHIDDPGVLQAVAYLLERLPEQVCVGIGSRMAPPLALARLRARGRVADYNITDLRFSEADTAALCAARGAAAEPQTVQQLLKLTDGWAVGLSLLAREAGRMGDGAAVPLQDREALFDFLAHEVLFELSQQEQEFVESCAVLGELTPGLCEALTGQPTAYRTLAELDRRNLLTLLEPERPTYRFHDLFRAFLVHRLEKDPARLAAVHARAAQVESDPLRQIGHLLDGGLAHQAADLMEQHCHVLMAQGLSSSIERLVRRLPPDVAEEHPYLCFLLGTAAWARWDLKLATRLFREAARLYRKAQDPQGEAQALFCLVPPLTTSSGNLEAPKALMEQLASQIPQQSAAWHVPINMLFVNSGLGNITGVRECSEALLGQIQFSGNDLLLQSLAVMGGGVNVTFLGLPRTQEMLEALGEYLLASDLGQTSSTLQAFALTTRVWVQLWRGLVRDAANTLDDADEAILRGDGLRGLRIDALRLRAMLAAITGQQETAIASVDELLPSIADAHGFRECWTGAYRHFATRIHWILGNRERLLAEARLLQETDAFAEWPFMRGARLVTQGYVAVAEGRLADAEVAFREAAAQQALFPMHSFCADARLLLANVLAIGERPAEAWEVFEPVAQAAIDENAGPLVMESREVVGRLWRCVPGAALQSERMVRLTGSLRAAGLLPEDGSPGGGNAYPMLTARERQVLDRIAEGASNKRIAIDLHLSVHTVKRHTANIRGKLGVSSRLEAAAWLRRHAP